MRTALIFVVALLAACSFNTEIPTEFPTPQPPPSATPLPKLDLKRDAALEKQFAEIAKDAKGKVGVAAVVLETGDAALLKADGHYPMQSVYKLPIAMAVMDEVRKDNHSLDEQIGVTKDDYVRQGQASPLRDKNPNGGVFTLRELIRLALVESDGSASDVLLRVIGGPTVVQSYLSQIGIEDVKVINTEKELGKDWETQYQNWATPLAAIEVLRYLNTTGRNATVTERALTRPVDATNVNRATAPDSDDDGDNVVLNFAINVVTGPNRLKGLLPKGTTVAHKTGTGGTKDSITGATNDIGIIYLPNGKHFAVAVFVSDSPADEKTREAVIARIARAAWDKWSK
jgi:Beta-lactamase class A